MRSQKALIDYYREILDKISLADAGVFRKELRKAFRQLLPEEREQLKHWFRTACVCKVPEMERVPVRRDR